MFMDEQTVNNSLDFTEEEVATSKPEENTEETTVEETNEQQTDNADSTTVEDSKEQTENNEEVSDDYTAFIKSKGLDPNDPETPKKMADMYKNAEKLMGEKSQEAARLQRMIAEQSNATGKAQEDSNEVLRREVQTLKNNEAIRDFRTRVNPTPEIEAKMAEYLSSPMQFNGNIISRGQLVMAGMMSLDDVYKLVGGGQVDPNQLKEQVRKQTLVEVANKQRAARPASSATDQTAFSQNDPYDSFLDGLGN
jgi:cysteinyl-tRNA synthetase